MSRRLKPGDVCELVLPNDKFGYLLYIGKHATYGDTVFVAPCEHAKQTSYTEVFSNGYVAFYPLSTAVRRGLLEIVGEARSVPELPGRFRRAGVRSNRGIETWVIEDSAGNDIAVQSRLSADELRTPIAAIWTHEGLVQSLARGWRPEHEVGAT